MNHMCLKNESKKQKQNNHIVFG